jgi:hypothetical protein
MAAVEEMSLSFRVAGPENELCKGLLPPILFLWDGAVKKLADLLKPNALSKTEYEQSFGRHQGHGVVLILKLEPL